ncbi:DNA repair protein RecO [Candidatus Dojkabacteria bacterium]|nr:DNA repair protein RecO [Candidatus Dojkabacteria bacterium]
MAIYKDIGIIFKIKDFSEADKLISILGKKNGRIDAIVKGARRPVSRKTGSIDLFNKAKFAFAEGRNLDILTEVELLDSYEKSKESLATSKYLFYFAELIDIFFPEVSQGSDIFSYISEILTLLNNDNKAKLAISFELKLLSINGFGPNLETCNLCGEKIVEKVQRVAHTGSEIGFICRRHLKRKNCSQISDRVFKIIKFFSRKSLDDVLNLKLEENDQQIIEKLNKLWIQSIIGKQIKSYKFLK